MRVAWKVCLLAPVESPGIAYVAGNDWRITPDYSAIDTRHEDDHRYAAVCYVPGLIENGEPKITGNLRKCTPVPFDLS